MNDTLVSLKKELEKISDFIIDKSDVFYFDYPLHLNVGDLLIYAGTEQFFRDFNINIRLRRCLQSFSINEVKKHIRPNTTLLCHGGGNFGDLYPSIQKLREDLVTNFPNNRIIILPQTAYFSNSKEMERSASVFSSHQYCYLFARDTITFQLMKQKFSNNVFLSPDMAHQLYGELSTKIENNLKSQMDTLYFLRKDIESSHIETQIKNRLSDLTNIKDWEDLLTLQDIKYELFCSRLAKIANILNCSYLKNKVNDMWYCRTLDIIKRMQYIFLKYDLIITSRLHGHIFSCLLELPNYICDNSYGKNFNYYNQWTKNINFTNKYEL
ncbi:polysaccharide pyruvyl transferase family protein [Seminibacterium arietis]|uniref:Polysaccharide pyruvyl transferase family protein n=1 Tax=Seminibacterium arietis TaxID=1173502 RepID=A0ABW3I6A6_9PAST